MNEKEKNLLPFPTKNDINFGLLFRRSKDHVENLCSLWEKTFHR